MSAPWASRNRRTSRMSSAVRTNDTATKSTRCSMPNLRSPTSFSVRQDAGRSTCGSEMPLWSLIRPPATTTQRTSCGVVASTRSWIMPSSIQISSPALTRPRYSGGETNTRSAEPTHGVRQRANGRPDSRSTRPPPPSPKVPSRIFGPCRSCRMATGRFHRASASRMRWMTSACSACVPFEKFTRATSIPSAARPLNRFNGGRACPHTHRELGRQLHAGRFPAGERGGRLPEVDVVEADVVQGLQLRLDDGHGLEELEGLVDGHVEDFGDVLAFVVDVERLAVVALALAHVAGDVDVGQEVHLDLHEAVALARLAAPALDVEREAPGLVAAHPRLLRPGEQRADEREDAGVGGRVAARRAPDRRLVDVDDLVDVLGALDARVCAGPVLGAVQHLRERAVEDVVDERGLAR